MCRITILNTSVLGETSRDILNSLLLLSVVEKQTDGVGFTDGNLIVKSGLSYAQVGINKHLGSLDKSRLWLAHNRQASPGTKTGTDAAHPYHFHEDGNRLIAVHNGRFDINGDPTDSFVFFKMFFEELKARGHRNLEEFFGKKMFSTSKYAIAYYWNGELFALRNDQRELFALFDKDSWVAVHTSKENLLFVSDYLGIDGQIVSLPDQTLFKFGRDYIREEKKVALPKYEVAPAAAYHYSYSKPKLAAPKEQDVVRIHNPIRNWELDAIDLKFNTWKNFTSQMRGRGYDEAAIAGVVSRFRNIHSPWYAISERQMREIGDSKPLKIDVPFSSDFWRELVSFDPEIGLEVLLSSKSLREEDILDSYCEVVSRKTGMFKVGDRFFNNYQGAVYCARYLSLFGDDEVAKRDIVFLKGEGK